MDYLELEISDSAAVNPSFPFALSQQGVTAQVISDATNHGYGVFSGLTVKEDAANGTATIPITATYHDLTNDSYLTTEFSAIVNITGSGASSSGGSS